MEEQKLFSFEYPIFSTNCIKIKFTCNSCGTVIEDSICEIPKPNLDGVLPKVNLDFFIKANKVV